MKTDDKFWRLSDQKKALRLAAFRRHRNRFARHGAKIAEQVAEFCARKHPNGHADLVDIQAETARLADAVLQGRFDRGVRSSVLWVPEQGPITRLTSALAIKIAQQGREGFVAFTLPWCWLSHSAWSEWLRYRSREAPASWFPALNSLAALPPEMKDLGKAVVTSNMGHFIPSEFNDRYEEKVAVSPRSPKPASKRDAALKQIENGDPALGVKELAARTGYSKSTITRAKRRHRERSVK